MKKRIAILSTLYVIFLLAISAFILKFEKDSKKITILFTTDVHTKIDYENGEGLTYGNVVALRKDLEEKGQTVFVVDSGDNIQGLVYGGFDEGESIKNIIGAAGYDASGVGNHEFDYGVFRALQIMETAKYPYISCNFSNLFSEELMLPAHAIIEKNGVKVGFVGITTPETLTKTTPIYFQDENGNMIYSFSEGKDGTLFYSAVQKAIDEIRDEVDYVVALGHLGDAEESKPYRSSDVINNTTGIDLFLDGHSHVLVPEKIVSDKDNNPVVLSQAGSYFSCIGVADLSKYETNTKLITEYENTDSETDKVVKEYVDTVQEALGKKLAVLDNPLYVNDAADNTKRLIRSRETNISDFVSDSIYWYFNEKLNTPCDIAIANGGRLRTDVEQGDFSALSSKAVQPFGNVLCMVEISGQEVLDMLEWGVRYVGAGESGGLLHAAGLTFKVNKDMESTVQNDEETYAGAPTGEYKVNDVKVYNKETCEYEPLDLNKTYNVAGINYILRNGEDGYSMLKGAQAVVDYVGEDFEATADFASNFMFGNDGFPHINNANSPMSKYKNYIYDYENPLGGGRMVIE